MSPSKRAPITGILLATCLALMALTTLSAASPQLEPQTPTHTLLEKPTCGHGEPVPLIELPLSDDELIPLMEECPGLRPGARLVSPGCTMNFLFTDGTEYYLGTAGHCTSHVGERKRASGVGEFGTVVFRHFTGIGQDFALIQVDQDRHDELDATLCTWTGPRDAEPLTHPGQVVHMYGWGVATNEEPYTRARSGALLTSTATTINFVGLASGGDSGSPSVNALGSALGINTHVLLSAQGSPVVYGTHIDQALDLSRNAGFDVEVVPGDWIL